MTQDDIAYFRRRADEERHRAALCNDPEIALVHRRMASEYDNAVAGAVPSAATRSPMIFTWPPAGREAR